MKIDLQLAVVKLFPAVVGGTFSSAHIYVADASTTHLEFFLQECQRWVGCATVVYTGLMACHLLWKWGCEIKDRFAARKNGK